MAKINHHIPELDTQGLRKFGFMMAAIIAVLFGLFLPWVLNIAMPMWPWIIALIFFLWSLVLPNSLKPVYEIWMRFGLLLNKVTTPIILGIVFYVVLLPIAVIMRMIKRDSQFTGWDKTSKTYRTNSESRSAESMEKPF